VSSLVSLGSFSSSLPRGTSWLSFFVTVDSRGRLWSRSNGPLFSWTHRWLGLRWDSGGRTSRPSSLRNRWSCGLVMASGTISWKPSMKSLTVLSLTKSLGFLPTKQLSMIRDHGARWLQCILRSYVMLAASLALRSERVIGWSLSWVNFLLFLI